MSDSSTQNQYDVAVIGCGLMGAALAKNFAANGLKVAAWNRSPEKAEALAGDNITPVVSAADAVAGTNLVIGCTSTYTTTRDALSLVADWTGKTLANIGTSTPTEAADMDQWTTTRGGRYLDGAILCYPQQIGGDEGMVLYSGSPEAWADHEKALMTAGPYSSLVSDNVKVAAVLDAAVIGGFYSAALNAYVEAATYALNEGVAPEVLTGISELAFQTIGESAKAAVEAISTDRHETDVAYLGVYAEGCRATLSAMRDAGYKARLLGAAVENLNEAEAAGLSGLGFFALTKVARADA
ncbi:NAD(P)-binding domain-containing protein [Nocardioides sp. LS1]|uniref:NAD(P)-binding domain-containing protein n=1 Tax=Nocardioides sp. LS1 TaxID=1027620 RepID=UPI000F61A92C|nr:NAD(P)-binding domain-containing protein [Nocardioides sp. LS1]GCD88115.1 3-hydroxyisobutyrate dehydrogenase [Nocardioides sp. LS1]